MSKKVVVITGPTSSGKSNLAYQLACRHSAVVLCADAMTIYKDLNVGTAKPSLSERFRIRHYGLDLRDLNEDFSVSDFRTLALEVVENNEKVIIVGGTQYYITALLKPHAKLPSADWKLREDLSKHEDIYGWLSRCDAKTAERLHPNDRVRIIRALEVFVLTGTPMSVLLETTPTEPLIDAEVFFLDSEDLRIRIRARIGKMVAQGYLDEAEQICFSGVTGQEKPLKSFSYAPMIKYFRGELSLSETLWEIEKGTWHLARKQRTWGRKMGWEPVSKQNITSEVMKVFK